jgi:hypothetical protein
MYLQQNNSDELVVLMDLRLAFGPGTRLWANRTREDFCYDWLKFKGERKGATLRDFAAWVLSSENSYLPDRKALCDIRRRVVAVLRAHHVRRPRQTTPAVIAPSSGDSARTNSTRVCFGGTSTVAAAGPHGKVPGLPVRTNKAAS